MNAGMAATLAATVMAVLMVSCASAPDVWPSETVKIEQLRPLAPVRLQMSWMSAQGQPTGSVSLRAHLRADGTVGAVQMLETSGRRELDQAAVMALRLARFQPHLVNGAPVEATLLAKFNLPDSKQQAR